MAISGRTPTSFKAIIKDVFRWEGGYVNDPKDRGGETKYGISKRAYPRLNIRSLTRRQAEEIYRKDYWIRYKVSLLPARLRHIYFDMCVNMGGRAAGRVLQRAANSRGAKLRVDGMVGPKTRRAVARLEPTRLRSYRLRYYCELVKNRPSQERFWFGWYKRATQV